MEKVHFTPLIYTYCLVFDPNRNTRCWTPTNFSNRTFNPLGGFASCFGSVFGDMTHVVLGHAIWLPHSGGTALGHQLRSPVARLTPHLAPHSVGGPGRCYPRVTGPANHVSSPANRATSQSVAKMSGGATHDGDLGAGVHTSADVVRSVCLSEHTVHVSD
jgi:hypothetical protein